MSVLLSWGFNRFVSTTSDAFIFVSANVWFDEFDLDITLPEDNRDVIYGVIKDCFKEPVRDAVVKLTEIVYDCGKEERRPIGHTFTDEEGEFVFGPLCPDRHYALQIWANTTKKIKICAKCHHEGKCLKGEKHEKCDCFIDDKKPCHKEDKCDCCKDEKYDGDANETQYVIIYVY